MKISGLFAPVACLLGIVVGVLFARGILSMEIILSIPYAKLLFYSVIGILVGIALGLIAKWIAD